MEPTCECTERTAAVAEKALFELLRLTNNGIESLHKEISDLKAALVGLVDNNVMSAAHSVRRVSIGKRESKKNLVETLLRAGRRNCEVAKLAGCSNSYVTQIKRKVLSGGLQ
jgi:regulator of replication initiation timing